MSSIASYLNPIRLPTIGRPSSHRVTAAQPVIEPDKGHILVVDDEHAIADFVAEVLRDEGYCVRVVHDGASALLDINARRPALILLDIALPVMVGDELLRYLRRHGYADLPIIVMTASLRPERYLACGATAVLPKPFEVNRLLDKVQDYVQPAEE